MHQFSTLLLLPPWRGPTAPPPHSLPFPPQPFSASFFLASFIYPYDHCHLPLWPRCGFLRILDYRLPSMYHSLPSCCYYFLYCLPHQPFTCTCHLLLATCHYTVTTLLLHILYTSNPFNPNPNPNPTPPHTTGGRGSFPTNYWGLGRLVHM